MTVNLGSYTGSTTNASSADSGPNDEANNHPRLGVGCLITPFAATALPIIPTNTKLIIDEVYWDKNSIDVTTVINLYNAMPDKNNKNIIAEPFIATDDFLMPAISTNVLYSASAMTSSAELINPSLYVERFIIKAAELMEASALMTSAIAFQNIIINSDVMVSTATFNDAGAIITIPGGTMTATLAEIKNPSLINGLPQNEFTAYIRYLRIESKENSSIPMMKEIL